MGHVVRVYSDGARRNVRVYSDGARCKGLFRWGTL